MFIVFRDDSNNKLSINYNVRSNKIKLLRTAMILKWTNINFCALLYSCVGNAGQALPRLLIYLYLNFSNSTFVDFRVFGVRH